MTTVAAARAGCRRAAESQAFDLRHRLQRARAQESERQEQRRAAALQEVAQQRQDAAVAAAELAAQVRALPRGRILALASRSQGENGIFYAGDVGLGHFVTHRQDLVEIRWPSCTSTRTTWPNVSWYVGQPFSASEVVGIPEGLVHSAMQATPISEVSTCEGDWSCAAETELSEILAPGFDDIDTCDISPCAGQDTIGEKLDIPRVSCHACAPILAQCSSSSARR